MSLTVFLKLCCLSFHKFIYNLLMYAWTNKVQFSFVPEIFCISSCTELLFNKRMYIRHEMLSTFSSLKKSDKDTYLNYK